MADRKWGAIGSGATFEALATTIVFFEDSKASLFGRRGRDGGQDARSGDGKRVFQAKHHEDGSAAAAIRDAKKEAATVRLYRQPDHPRHEQWRGVTHWRLVTNAAFNPTDKQTWDTTVVPLFASQGLAADYWERENLNALLDKHPEIHRSFFENETRAFLSISELRERLPRQEPFLRRDQLGAFCGRTTELEQVRSFLASPQLFLVVHGAGGMGKTRLLVQAGEEVASGGSWQVLWANVASMAVTGAWFESVVPERPTLVLVDEPPDDTVLQQLSEQLGGRVGRTAHWKVAVAVRSPKDHVLRFLFGSRLKPWVRELAIGALPDVDAEDMCSDLLKTGKLGALPEERRRDAARELSRRFSRHPVWLTLAVQHLEERGNLTKVPATAKELADEYLTEVEESLGQSAASEVRDLLRWVALLGTVNRADDATVKLIAEGSKAGGLLDVRRKLAALVKRRALIERGAHNRFVELKPDVLRDHVLLGWLSVDVGFGAHPVVASENAKALLETVRESVVAGTPSGFGRAILVSLARTEFLLRLSGNDVQLMVSFFDALQAAVPTMTASQRGALTEMLEAIARFQPSATARLVGTLRTSETPDEVLEGIFGARVVRHNDVVLALAWPTFLAAMGAQSSEDQEGVLRELCALAEAEAVLAPHLKRGLPNDGKRAAALVARVLEGGPQFWREFDETAKTLGKELLAELAMQPPTPGKPALLKALVQPAIAVERRQTWSDDRAIHIKTFAIGPDHPAWTTRSELLGCTKDTLSADTTPVASRIALWHLFAEAHRNFNQLRLGAGKQDHQHNDALLSDLVWARELLSRRSTSVEELSAARELWDWHYRFETDAQLKDASERLEILYATNELAAEFEPLLSRDDWEQRGPRASAKAETLSTARAPEEIAGFVERAVAFLGSDRELRQLTDVAWSLGTHAETHDVVRVFVKRSLEQVEVSARTDFGVTTAASWVFSVRRSDHPERTHGLVVELMALCGSDAQRAELLLRIYGRIPTTRGVAQISADEHALLRAQRRLFSEAGRSDEFLAAIASTIDHDWPTLQTLIEDMLRSPPPTERLQALRSVVDSTYRCVRDSDVVDLPIGLVEWLLNQLLIIQDLDDLGDMSEWYLEEILKRVGRVHVSWLPGAIAVRRELEAKEGDEPGNRAVGFNSRLGQYVKHVTAADVGDGAVLQAIAELLEFAVDKGSVGYHLPKLLRDVDPDGVLVPAVVAARIASTDDPEQTRRLSRIGAAYVVGSLAWRAIAKAALVAGRRQGAEAHRALFDALGDRGIRSWTAKLGEVPSVFVSAVEEARTALDTEADVDLRAFWESRLAVADADLREQKERAKEERGE